MRWVWPGEYTIGSPKDEPDRKDDETQHPVILIRGYWLAETACTQDLWQAVMGNNPSMFKGEQRPVENVSWTDVQGFVTRLDETLAGVGRSGTGLRLRLPAGPMSRAPAGSGRNSEGRAVTDSPRKERVGASGRRGRSATEGRGLILSE